MEQVNVSLSVKRHLSSLNIYRYFFLSKFVVCEIVFKIDCFNISCLSQFNDLRNLQTYCKVEIVSNYRITMHLSRCLQDKYIKRDSTNAFKNVNKDPWFF